ncbi:MAG: hypothetical protein C4288_12805, partial [Leptolyngbya sp. ERB_1_1]
LLGVSDLLLQQGKSSHERDFNRMSRLIEQMTIAAENLADQLESLFHLEAPIAANQFEALVRETVELVKIHMPSIDALSVR